VAGRAPVRRVPASRLVLMPYGIPLAELDTPLSRLEARERLGLSGGGLVIGVVGRLEEQKRPCPPAGGAAGTAPRDPNLVCSWWGRPAGGGFTAPGPGAKIGEHRTVSGHPAGP